MIIVRILILKFLLLEKFEKEFQFKKRIKILRKWRKIVINCTLYTRNNFEVKIGDLETTVS